MIKLVLLSLLRCLLCETFRLISSFPRRFLRSEDFPMKQEETHQTL